MALLTGLSSLPWMVKPICESGWSHWIWKSQPETSPFHSDGFISDSIPLFGYRRRSYLIACGLLGAASWTVLATWVDSPNGTVIAMIMASLSTAFSDVVVDSIVVERARGASQVMMTTARIQNFAVGDSALLHGTASDFPPALFSHQATQGSLQSLCWASAAVGGIVSAYFSGSLVEDFGTR